MIDKRNANFIDGGFCIYLENYEQLNKILSMYNLKHTLIENPYPNSIRCDRAGNIQWYSSNAISRPDKQVGFGNTKFVVWAKDIIGN